MFTGIVEEVGKVARIETSGENRRIVIATETISMHLRTGDSCAVSGVCLTALDITPNSFSADLAPETWVRTSLSRIVEGALVNLERPLRVEGRMDGHIVQGHSDDYWLRVEVPAELEKYLVYKGSIAIEGISLTVARLEDLICTIAIIPHTVEMTNLHSLKPGDSVNVETDIVAKYLEKWIGRGDFRPAMVTKELASQRI